LEAKAKERGVDLLLTDVVVADKFAADANAQTVSIDNIPDDGMGLDIGPESVKTFQDALADCKTVIWNGPMGVFEFDQFAQERKRSHEHQPTSLSKRYHYHRRRRLRSSC